MANNNPQNSGAADRCEVCGGSPPPGHRFCDNCWPDATIAAGKAARCAICGNPKIIEKLQPQFGTAGPLVCATHSAKTH